MADVLRYPYDLLTETTDYLQIDLVQKTYAGSTGGGTKQLEYKGTGEAGTGGKVPLTVKNLIRDRRNNPLTNSRVPKVIKNETKLLEKNKFISKSNGIIILPIPSNISDSNSVSFSEDKLDAVTAAAGGIALSAMNTDFGPNFTNDLIRNVKAAFQNAGSNITSAEVKDLFLGNLATQAAGIAGIGNMTLDQLLARSQGSIVNPNMELLFNGPTIRSFKFSFKFTPRSQHEANQVKLIIGSLKRHMAPQQSGLYLGTPNFFELRYRKWKRDHEFLNKFKQCVLENMNVNYTGENTYATYSDGTPVSMIMDLTFKELEPIYSSDYDSLTPEDGVGY